MSDVEQYAKDLEELVAYATEFKNKVGRSCGGSFKWGVGEVLQSYRSMFDRFCPYKIGDRVQLKSSCRINDPTHGWYGCRHFLVKGAKATVRERGYTDGQFTFMIEFDNETWIDSKGKELPVTSKHVFHFGENSLVSVEE